MKAQLIYILFLFLTFSLAGQETFSVSIVPSKLTYRGSGQLDIYGNPLKGATFGMSGYIYSGDYFENNCPNLRDCGITVVLTQDTVYAFSEDSLEIIGRWDVFGYTTQDMATALASGGAATYSTQVFLLSENFDECPGCKIVTEGQDYYGGADNVYFKRTIAGGTTEISRLMRGDLEQIIYQQPENKNETGGYNMRVTFRYFKN